MVAVKLLEDSKITVGNAFLTAKICTKFIFSQGFVPDPAGGAHNTPTDLLVKWGGGHPLLRCCPHNTYGILFSATSAPRRHCLK